MATTNGKSATTVNSEQRVVLHCGLGGSMANSNTSSVIVETMTPPYTTVGLTQTIREVCTKVGAPTNGLTPAMLDTEMQNIEMYGEGDANNVDFSLLIAASTKPTKFRLRFMPALAATALTGRMERRTAAMAENTSETGELRTELAVTAARQCMVSPASPVSPTVTVFPAQADMPNKSGEEGLATVAKANRARGASVFYHFRTSLNLP